jgi:hypothetical protein
MSLGLYLQELIRRTDPAKRTLGCIFHEEIASPLKLDVYIGLPIDFPDRRRARLRTLSAFRALTALFKTPPAFILKTLQPASLLRRSMLFTDLDWNDRRVLELEIPSGSAVSTARAIARAYSVFAEGGEKLGITPSTIAALTAPPHTGLGRDAVLGVESYYSLGF